MILDASGVIRFAATGSLFGWSDEELSGGLLQSLLPALPLRQSTPGYNVAYMRMAFADQSWQRHCAVAADGSELCVELFVRPLPIGRSYAFLTAVREIITPASSSVARQNMPARLFDIPLAA